VVSGVCVFYQYEVPNGTEKLIKYLIFYSFLHLCVIKQKVMEWQNYIVSNPKILYGKPHIKGTRIGVDLVLEKLSLGESIEQLLNSYPHINTTSILACLSFAAAHIRSETIYPLAA
jgi:uncharacterized protein (DUF433 family)